MHSKWQLVASWYALYHNILLLDSSVGQCLLRAAEEGIDDLGIPPGVDDADTESRSWKLSLALVFLDLIALELEKGAPEWVANLQRDHTIVRLRGSGSFQCCHCDC